MGLETFTNVNWPVLWSGLTLLLTIFMLVYSLKYKQGNRGWWLLFGGIAGLVLAAFLLKDGLIRSLLIDGAALLAVGMVFLSPQKASKKIAFHYLWMMVLSIGLLIAAELMGENVQTPLMSSLVALFWLVGFCLKLALIPLYFWLPGVVEFSTPITAAVIIAVVDISAFQELAVLRLAQPWVFEQYGSVWLVVGLISIIGGALFALGQHSIRRMLAFSTIDDLGYLLIGVLVGDEIGLTGAMVGAFAHAFFKVLLFAAVGCAEDGLNHPLTLSDRGLATRYPVSAAAYIVGSLGMIGVPPLFGFVGRWRLYEAAISYGGWGLGLVLAVGTVFALLYYVRSIHRVWLGDGVSSGTPEPKVIRWLMIGFMMLALMMGVFPAFFLGLG